MYISFICKINFLLTKKEKETSYYTVVFSNGLKKASLIYVFIYSLRSDVFLDKLLM